MSRSQIGGVSVEVPGGWEDESLLTLVAPLEPSAMLPRVKQPAELRSTVILKRHRPSAPIDLEAWARVQERMIAGAIPGAEIVARGTHTLSGTGVEALTREIVLDDGADQLRQLHLYFSIGGSLFMFCGTARNDARFDQARGLFIQLADGLRVSAHPQAPPRRVAWSTGQV